MPVHLSGKTKSWAHGNFRIWAANMNCLFGMVSKGDILQYVIGDVISLGRAVGFARTLSNQHAAFVAPLARVNAQSWRQESDMLVMVPDGLIVGCVPYFTCGAEIFPLLHSN